MQHQLDTLVRAEAVATHEERIAHPARHDSRGGSARGASPAAFLSDAVR
jgi:hypothetical protein